MSLPSGMPTIDFARELNEQQLAAVTSQDGPALVLAGAGSGKTRTLTYRVAYLLSKNVAPWQILLLTFTNKAAKQMLERVEALTGVARTQFWGGTFHHIGMKILRQNGERIGLSPSFTIVDESESESLLTEAIKAAAGAGFLKDKNNPKAPLISSILSFCRNTLRPIADVIRARYGHLEDKIGMIEKFNEHYTLLKRSRQLVDYDDLLVLWLKLLQENPDVAAKMGQKFSHVLVDEYQDTNALQTSIIKMMAPHHRIMAVGDDAQCIYTWRGADVENILSFTKEHPGAKIYKIEINYRSTPPILNLANSVLTAARPEFEKQLRASRTGTSKPMVVPVVDGRAQAQFIVSRVQALRREGKNLAEIAVLYRAHFHAMEIQLELTRLGIPFTITSGVRFFEQAHVKDLVAQLRFVSNHKDSAAFLRMSCLLPKVGEITALKWHAEIILQKQAGKTLAQAMREIRVGEQAREEFNGLTDTTEELEEAMKNQELPSAVTRRAIEGWYSGYIRTLYPNWDTRMEDLQSLESFANRFEDFSEYLSQLVLLGSETTERGDNDSGDKLRLSTVHQAKGLEFPVVFVVGLSEGMFPGRRAIEEGTLDEEKRLFYVAVTRAQDELYLSYPLLNMNAHAGNYQQMPSRFLEKLPQDSFELLKISGGSANSGGTGGLGNGWNTGGFRSGTGTKPKTYSSSKSGFSQKSGTFDDLPSEKSFNEKTNTNAKKLFKW